MVDPVFVIVVAGLIFLAVIVLAVLACILVFLGIFGRVAWVFARRPPSPRALDSPFLESPGVTAPPVIVPRAARAASTPSAGPTGIDAARLLNLLLLLVAILLALAGIGALVSPVYFPGGIVGFVEGDLENMDGDMGMMINVAASLLVGVLGLVLGLVTFGIWSAVVVKSRSHPSR